MKAKHFSNIVKSPWFDGTKNTQKTYSPTTTIYADGEFFVSKLFEHSYLFFKKIGEEYCAFQNLAGFKAEHIEKIKAVLAGGNTDDWLVQRSVDCIKQWEGD